MKNSKVTKSGMELPILTFGSTKIDSPTRVDYTMKVDGCEKNMEASLCPKGRPFSKALIFLTRTSFSKALKKSDKVGSLILKISNLWISLSKRQNRVRVNQFDNPTRTSNERNCNFFVNITLPLIPSIYILDSDLILSELYRFPPIPSNFTGFWTVLSKIYRFLPDDTLLFLFS